MRIKDLFGYKVLQADGCYSLNLLPTIVPAVKFFMDNDTERFAGTKPAIGNDCGLNGF